MLSLNQKVIHQLESKQEVFRGLKGLRITEFKKIVKAIEPMQHWSFFQHNTGGSALLANPSSTPTTAISQTALAEIGPQKLNQRSESQIRKFWNNNCLNVPISGKKVREHFREND